MYLTDIPVIKYMHPHRLRERVRDKGGKRERDSTECFIYMYTKKHLCTT